MEIWLLALGAIAFVAFIFLLSTRKVPMVLGWAAEGILWIPVIIIAGLLHLGVGIWYALKRAYLVADEGISEMLRKK